MELNKDRNTSQLPRLLCGRSVVSWYGACLTMRLQVAGWLLISRMNPKRSRCSGMGGRPMGCEGPLVEAIGWPQGRAVLRSTAWTAQVLGVVDA